MIDPMTEKEHGMPPWDVDENDTKPPEKPGEVVEEKPKKKEPILAKKELDMLKFHLSSIFGRKQKFIYIDPTNINVWHFTNIPPDWGYVKDQAGIFIHKNDVNSFYHTVTVKDPIIVEYLTRLFPIVLERPTCIAVNEIMAIVNKKKTDEFIFNEDGVYFEKTVGKKGPIDVKAIGFVDTETVDFVANTVKTMVARVDKASKKLVYDIDKNTLDKSKVSYLQAEWPDKLPDGTTPKVSLPLCDGFNIICCNEYLKKVKEEHTLTATVMADQAAVRFIVEFENPKVHIYSGIPSTLWFPKAN